MDCANGATYYAAPHVFAELGAEVIEIGCDPDGVNINEGCGSTHPEALITAVKDHQADYGIAFDGDGDRVLFVDRTGRLYDGDKLIYLILNSYEAKGKRLPGVVGTVMTNMGMEVALIEKGYQFVRAKVGDRYVVEELLARDWTLGGEASGHILCLDKHSTGDGIVAALQVLAGIVILDKSLAEVIDWAEYPQTMINVRLIDKGYPWQELAKDTIAKVEQELGNYGRVVVRASGTEPLLRVMVEAKDAELAKQSAEKIVGSIKG